MFSCIVIVNTLCGDVLPANYRFDCAAIDPKTKGYSYPLGNITYNYYGKYYTYKCNDMVPEAGDGMLNSYHQWLFLSLVTYY